MLALKYSPVGNSPKTICLPNIRESMDRLLLSHNKGRTYLALQFYSNDTEKRMIIQLMQVSSIESLVILLNLCSNNILTEYAMQSLANMECNHRVLKILKSAIAISNMFFFSSLKRALWHVPMQTKRVG